MWPLPRYATAWERRMAAKHRWFAGPRRMVVLWLTPDLPFGGPARLHDPLRDKPRLTQRTLVREVGVNVIANLIANLITLGLAGAVVGVLLSDSPTVWYAGLAVCLFGAGPTGVLIRVVVDRRMRRELRRLPGMTWIDSEALGPVELAAVLDGAGGEERDGIHM